MNEETDLVITLKVLLATAACLAFLVWIEGRE